MSEGPVTSVKTSRDRKRELDRKAQRSARERTKRRIAQLEATVAHLQKTNGDGRAVSLTDHLSQVMRERDTLRDCLESLGVTIRSHLERIPATIDRSPCTTSKGNSPKPLHSAQESDVLPPLRMQSHKLDNFRTETNEDVFPGVFDTHSWPVLSLESGSQTGMYANSNDSIDTVGQTLFNNTSTTVFEDFSRTNNAVALQSVPSEYGITLPPSISDASMTSIWQLLGAVLEEASIVYQANLVSDIAACEDYIIRAVMNGWPSIRDSAPMPVACNTLRIIDDICVKDCSPIDRLAMLSLFCIMVVNMQHSERRSHLPRWLQPRPCQSLPHPIHIDYVFWPGVREQMVFSQHKYSTDGFSMSAFSHTRFSWPFAFRDAYVCNSATAKFQLSPHFRQAIQDLNSWDVTYEFFEQYPELRDDVKGYDFRSL
ncbi:hypothetical protein FB567DRAFT_435249 [Paraphoma chrysanthemicola]|uniref:BZIP domain-containing protein n=1 Tax=Paraphoma chrysanthemicola TaxID=798071 RepID=A0A8K0RCM1_9PLEO|nr:hypothetical protein FB567DRAFT_435249 [Paraphoma chrysanthemicola]